jgi:ligand-binding sensor domain-containing protein
VKRLLAACVGCGFAWLQTHGTPAQWMERVQRFPLPSLRPAPPKAPAIAGETLAVRELERVELPGDVVALVEAGDALYAGTFDQGLLRVERGAAPRRLPIDERVNDLALDRASGTLYAATNGGAYEIGRSARRISPGVFAAAAVWRGQAVFASRAGISVLEAQGLRTLGPAQGVRASAPMALANCGEALCIGASDGLWVYDGETCAHHAAGELPEEQVTAVARGEDGVWAGTLAGGVARVPALSMGAPDGRVAPHALLARGGEVFFGTPSGLVALRGGRAGIVRGLGPVTALTSSARGGIWIGLRGAAVRVELEGSALLAEARR